MNEPKWETVDQNQNQHLYAVELQAKDFGIWRLGYGWVMCSIGDASTTGLALYAQRANDPPIRRIVFSLKEAIDWMAENRIPPRWAGQLLAAATDNGEFDNA